MTISAFPVCAGAARGNQRMLGARERDIEAISNSMGTPAEKRSTPAGAMSTTISPRTAGLLWGAVAVVIWGAYLAVARGNVAAGIAPADVVIVRFATAGLILSPWYLSRARTTLNGLRWWQSLALVSLAGPPFILAGVMGFRFAPLSHGAAMQPASVAVVGLVLGAVVLRERVTFWRFVGAGIMLAGLAVIAVPSAFDGGRRAAVGDAFFILAGAMWAAFAVLSRLWSVSPMASTAIVSVLSAVLFLPPLLLMHDARALLSQPLFTLVQLVVVHGILSGVVAVFAFGRAVEMLGASRAASLPALVPVVASLIGVPITGEVPSAPQLAGLATVTLGLVVSQHASTRNR
jgi:drug/metabolite transporter (DMT)-like permease